MKWIILFFLLTGCGDNTDEEFEKQNLLIMRRFQMSLQGLTSGAPSYLPPMTTPVDVLLGGVDTPFNSIAWFYPYLAADFPEILGITKKYIFIYSTDHAPQGTHWGQGDELDLSDFVGGGRTFVPGNSTETPILFRAGGNVCLSVHPSYLPQQTDVWITTGGSLNSIDISPNWTHYDNPLGLHTLANGNQINGEDETHTGYMIWNEVVNTLDGVTYQYECRHLGGGASFETSFHRYSYTNDGINFVREYQYNTDKHVLAPDFTNELRSKYFIKRGVIYSLDLCQPNSGVVAESWNKKYLALMRYDNNYRNPQFVRWINEDFRSDYSAFIDPLNPDLVHIYLCYPRDFSPTVLSYATLNISQL